MRSGFYLYFGTSEYGGITYSYDTFTASGSFNVPEGITQVDVLIVAGGGGGGCRQGGGGGAGGVRLVRVPVTPLESVSVTIGAGGAGGVSGGRGSSGGNSSFGGEVSLGGGGGGGRTTNSAGGDGGSGGGAAKAATFSPGMGQIAQGSSGGRSGTSAVVPDDNNKPGGGGGAGLPGEDGFGANDIGYAGDGGDGLFFNGITGYGSPEGWFGGGGGGGTFNSTAAGSGGLGGGGAGVYSSASTGPAANPGLANTGGGGGGSSTVNEPGGVGGSGIVIVSWPSGGISLSSVPNQGIQAPRALTIDDSSNSYFSISPDSLAAPASLIKMLTCLVAREWISDSDLSTVVTVNSSDLHPPTTANLQDGDQLTYRDLFYGTLVPSGNDASLCLGRHVGALIQISEGDPVINSRDRFIAEMNSYLANLGFSGAIASSTHGVDTTSRLSARQSAELLRSSFNDTFLAGVLGTLTHLMTITGVNARTYNVTHTVSSYVSQFPEFQGAKTGTYVGVAEYCIAMCWVLSDGSRRYSVIMGSPSTSARISDIRALLNHEIKRDAFDLG